MSRTGTVYDLGYAPHEGERLGRAGAMRAIVKDGVRRALGLRRKARSKVLPWLLIAAAIVPATVIVSLSFFLAGFNLPLGNPFASHANYFDTIGTLSLLFVALVAPTLLIPDRRYGVLAIYASRPVRAADYLLARAGALALMTALFILVPQATLYLGLAGLDDGGLWAGLTANVSEVPAILGSTVAYVLGYGAPAFLVAVYVRRATMATGVYVVLMMMSVALTEAIPSGGGTLSQLRYLSLLSLATLPGAVRNWFFGLGSRTPITDSGLPLWSAAVALVALVAVTGFLAHRRYRREL